MTVAGRNRSVATGLRVATLVATGLRVAILVLWVATLVAMGLRVAIEIRVTSPSVGLVMGLFVSWRQVFNAICDKSWDLGLNTSKKPQKPTNDTQESK